MPVPRLPFLALLFSLAVLLSPSAASQIQPSSDLLLPWFEVDLGDGGRTTLIALANASAAPVDVLISLRSNWGIPVLDVTLTLQAGTVRTVNLRDWLVLGRLPDAALAAGELAHVRAALSGRLSPRDGMYFSSPLGADLAVGSATFRAQGPRPDALWGDVILLDARRGSARGEALVNLDPSVEPRSTCSRHGVRFLAGSGASSELRVWTGRRGEPSSTPELAATHRIQATAEIFDEAGRLLGSHRLELLPVDVLDLGDLVAGEPFGWIDLAIAEDAFLDAVVDAGTSIQLALPAVCLPSRTDAAGPDVRIELFVDGEAADLPPGPSIPVGQGVEWRYVVTNIGDAPLAAVLVSDERGIVPACPGDSLRSGESMTCTSVTAALACQQEVTAMATGMPPIGPAVSDRATVHYFGGTFGPAAIDAEAWILGQDADLPPGPSVATDWLAWTMRPLWDCYVTNTGVLPLSGLEVYDDRGDWGYCGKTALAPGETTGCMGGGHVPQGFNAFRVKAVGKPACGGVVEDSDPIYFVGVPPPRGGIELEALVDGHSADEPPGPTLRVGEALLWTYVVVNTGEIGLSDVAVTREGGATVFCPRSELGPGESMTCSMMGLASAGLQQSLARATGLLPPRSPLPGRPRPSVSDTDSAYYFGALPAPSGGPTP